MTQSPGMSELIEKALADLLADLNEADEWLGAARTRRRNAAVKNATKRLSSTLLDDLAAAQGEIERLREALREFLNAGGVQWMSGMTTSSAWSLPKLAAASVKAHSALTLKSEKEGAE